MSEAHAEPWLPFRWLSRLHGWDPVWWMGMGAEHGGGQGRPGVGIYGAEASGSWNNPWGGGPFGLPFPPFPPFGNLRQFWGGPRVRRGDVRATVLTLLAEEPLNGYQIIQQIAERSGGVWRPSAASVYPALQQLEDEGLVRAVELGGRRLFELAEEGRAHIEAHGDERAAPWEVVPDTVGERMIEPRDLIGEVAVAAAQVLHAGSEPQSATVRRILTDVRQSLYRMLAEDESDDKTAENTNRDHDEEWFGAQRTRH